MGSGTRQLLVGTVLVVDDSTSVRQAIVHQLEHVGFRVTGAAEGIEGLWRARQSPFDLIVTDLHMPAMTGLQLVAELRKLPAYATTPVILLTSDESAERPATARQLGVAAVLKKPVDLDALVFHVRHGLDARQLNAQSR